jgi:hypothetical protein
MNAASNTSHESNRYPASHISGAGVLAVKLTLALDALMWLMSLDPQSFQALTMMMALLVMLD